MHILFLHDAFPAQFGRVGLELTERYGWKCSYVIRNLSACPTPTLAMLNKLDIRRYVVPEWEGAESQTPWPQSYGRFLEQCVAIHDVLATTDDLRPDLVVANGGRGAPTLLVPEVLGETPIITYCEYYFAKRGKDLTYRVDLPPAEPAPFFPRVINATTLTSLVNASSGYSATAWQRDSFPERFRHKIEVHFDGADVEMYRPGERAAAIAGRSVPPDVKVVTFVARGLESMRGFDVFLKVASIIARNRSDVLFVIAGDEKIYYGWDHFHAGGMPFRDWALARAEIDPSRLLFLGHILPEELAAVLRRSDLHLYLTVPFVLSWSLFNAMSSGLVVLASDVAPVREVIEPNLNGLIAPLFDVEILAEKALEVLANPAEYSPIGAAARRTIEEKYALDVTLPGLKEYFERVASRT